MIADLTARLPTLTHADVVGVLGTVLVCTTYLLTQTRRINSSDLAFPVANLIGTVLITYSLLHTFNLASMLIEIFWMAISLYGIAQWLRERRQSE